MTTHVQSLRQSQLILEVICRSSKKKYETRELPREWAARAKRKAKVMEADPGEETMEVSLTMKEFRLDTFKIHNLGHYYGDIARIGMLDNTSA